jgi:hypothetical protein
VKTDNIPGIARGLPPGTYRRTEANGCRPTAAAETAAAGGLLVNGGCWAKRNLVGRLALREVGLIEKQRR